MADRDARRSNAGKLPDKYADFVMDLPTDDSASVRSSSSTSSSKVARLRRLRVEAELKASEALAELQLKEIALQKDLTQKALVFEQAKLDEAEATMRSAASSVVSDVGRVATSHLPKQLSLPPSTQSGMSSSSSDASSSTSSVHAPPWYLADLANCRRMQSVTRSYFPVSAPVPSGSDSVSSQASSATSVVVTPSQGALPAPSLTATSVVGTVIPTACTTSVVGTLIPTTCITSVGGTLSPGVQQPMTSSSVAGSPSHINPRVSFTGTALRDLKIDGNPRVQLNPEATVFNLPAENCEAAAAEQVQLDRLGGKRAREHTDARLNDWVHQQQYSQYPQYPSTMHPGISAMHHVKQLEVPAFSGIDGEYSQWRQRFNRLIDDDPFVSEHYKLERLRQAVSGGSAAEIIAGIIDGTGAYEEALSELEQWYGGCDRELERQEKEILAWPKIVQERDTDGLKKFALKLRTMLVNMRLSGAAPGRELYISVTQKLPRALLLRYFERHDERNCGVQTLCDWLMKRVHTLHRVDERLSSTPGSSAQLISPARGTPRTRVEPRTSERTFATADTSAMSVRLKTRCLKCGGLHELSECAQFMALRTRERWNFVKPTELCTCCLLVGHRARDCTAAGCKSCGRKHHDLLHYESWQQKPEGVGATVSRNAANADKTPLVKSAQKSENVSKPSSPAGEQCNVCGNGVGSDATCLAGKALPSISFMLVPVVLRHGDDRIECTAMLDSGSTTSYVREDVVKAVGLTGNLEHLDATVLGGKKVSGAREHVSLSVESVDNAFSSSLAAWVLPSITSPVEPLDWNTLKHQWDHLESIQFPKIRGVQVDMLIGLNAVDLHAALEERRGHPADPIGRRTPLGWVCFGSGLKQRCTEVCHVATTLYGGEDLAETVKKFWEVESAGTHPALSGYECQSVADRQAEAVVSATQTHKGGRFEFGIPWSAADRRPHLRSNRVQAEQRLHSLERYLSKRPDISTEYARVMAAHQSKGYIRLVDEHRVEVDGDDQWYLPHFPVVRSDKTTSKVRIVYDAAARWDGACLNDQMHCGPALQNDIVEVLLRFSLEPVALVGDISEMFLQVGLHEQDRRYHRLLWRPNKDSVVQTYEFNRVVFGVKASPYLAGKAVKETVKLFGDKYSQNVMTMVDESIYVDDLLGSLPSVEAAISARLEVQRLLAESGFHLRKWLSNSASVIQSVPEEDRAIGASVSVGDHTHCALPTVKTLGVSWTASEDAFTFRYEPKFPERFTKRSVLSGLSSIFDPRGQIVPYAIRARLMFQDAWLLNLGWDDVLPANHQRLWQQWFGELPSLANIRVARCFKEPNQSSEAAKLSVHTFTDASDRAIAAVSYIRAEYPDETVRVTLAMAKAKPAPVRRQTFPQLEL